MQQEQVPAPPEDLISIGDIFHVLWVRRRLLVSTALFVMALGFIVLFQLEPRYTASSTLMIGVPDINVVDIEEVLSGGVTGSSAIASEVEVLRSRGLARRVAETLGLSSLAEFNPALREPGLWEKWNLGRLIPSRDWIPRDWLGVLGLDEEPNVEPQDDTERERKRLTTAASIVLSKLTIVPLGRSSVVEIRFESENPALAAEIANELPEAYIIGQLEAKLEATERATKWLDEQLVDLRERVESSENAVELYRQQQGLTEVRGTRILSDQLSEVSSQLIIARAERAQAEARLRQLNQLRKRGADLGSASEVQASSLLQRLKEQEAQVARKVSELSVEYGRKHPRMQQVLAELADIRGKITSEVNQIAAALQNDVEVARTKENSLAKSLAELEEQSADQTKQSIQLGALEREASANRALYETFLSRFKETTSTTGISEPDARVISTAEVPASASFPKLKKFAIVIIVGAFFAATGLVFFVESLSPGVSSPEQIESVLGLPAIGIIPLAPSKKPQDYVLTKPYSSFGEALNSLKTSLMLSSPDEPVKVIQVTSAVPKEGKTTLALSFARLLARTGKRVVVVDGDLRRSSLGKMAGVSETSDAGLTDLLLSSDKPMEEFLVMDKQSGAYILAKGGAKYLNATDMLSSHRMENILQSLKQAFDYVIIDSPPVLVVADARMLAKVVDKTVFLVLWDKTPKKVLRAAVKELTEAGADIAGCVLQKVNLSRYGSYGYGGSGYYYHYGRYGEYYTK